MWRSRTRRRKGESRDYLLSLIRGTAAKRRSVGLGSNLDLPLPNHFPAGRCCCLLLFFRFSPAHPDGLDQVVRAGSAPVTKRALAGRRHSEPSPSELLEN